MTTYVCFTLSESLVCLTSDLVTVSLHSHTVPTKFSYVNLCLCFSLAKENVENTSRVCTHQSELKAASFFSLKQEDLLLGAAEKGYTNLPWRGTDTFHSLRTHTHRSTSHTCCIKISFNLHQGFLSALAADRDCHYGADDNQSQIN